MSKTLLLSKIKKMNDKKFRSWQHKNIGTVFWRNVIDYLRFWGERDLEISEVFESIERDHNIAMEELRSAKEEEKNWEKTKASLSNASLTMLSGE